MEPRNPAYREAVGGIFLSARFVQDLGIELASADPGRCESVLAVAGRHLQQDGFVHAGVIATMADHTAGGAANTLVAAEETVLSAEFKINLLRPAAGPRLRCRAAVLKAGRTLIVAESEVFAEAPEGPRLVAKALVTLAVVPRPAARP